MSDNNTELGLGLLPKVTREVTYLAPWHSRTPQTLGEPLAYRLTRAVKPGFRDVKHLIPFRVEDF